VLRRTLHAPDHGWGVQPAADRRLGKGARTRSGGLRGGSRGTRTIRDLFGQLFLCHSELKLSGQRGLTTALLDVI